MFLRSFQASDAKSVLTFEMCPLGAELKLKTKKNCTFCDNYNFSSATRGHFSIRLSGHKIMKQNMAWVCLLVFIK